MTVEDLKYALKDTPDKAVVVFGSGRVIVDDAKYHPFQGGDDFTFGRVQLL